MRKFFKVALAAKVLLSIIGGAAYLYLLRVPAMPIPATRQPGISEDVQRQIRELQNAPIAVALVFGRSTGCDNADPALVNLVAQEAVRAGVPPKVLAAIVAVESKCNPMAISKAGAVGLTQVVPRVHKGTFDFTKVNLLNPQDNVHTGAHILASYIKAYGLESGVHHYNGMGTGCDYCDDMYSSKVLLLAGTGGH
jgi:soluble lytic murein transglycosylase-like protein